MGSKSDGTPTSVVRGIWHLLPHEANMEEIENQSH